MERAATVVRQTKETNIELTLGLDGGEVVVDTGVGFFDHMLTALAVHGGFGLRLKAEGDWNVDCHHTVEDTGIVLGRAFKQALGDRSGIVLPRIPVLPAEITVLNDGTHPDAALEYTPEQFHGYNPDGTLDTPAALHIYRLPVNRFAAEVLLLRLRFDTSVDDILPL